MVEQNASDDGAHQRCYRTRDRDAKNEHRGRENGGTDHNNDPNFGDSTLEIRAQLERADQAHTRQKHEAQVFKYGGGHGEVLGKQGRDTANEIQNAGGHTQNKDLRGVRHQLLHTNAAVGADAGQLGGERDQVQSQNGKTGQHIKYQLDRALDQGGCLNAGAGLVQRHLQRAHQRLVTRHNGDDLLAEHLRGGDDLGQDDDAVCTVPNDRPAKHGAQTEQDGNQANGRHARAVLHGIIGENTGGGKGDESKHGQHRIAAEEQRQRVGRDRNGRQGVGAAGGDQKRTDADDGHERYGVHTAGQSPDDATANKENGRKNANRDRPHHEDEGSDQSGKQENGINLRRRDYHRVSRAGDEQQAKQQVAHRGERGDVRARRPRVLVRDEAEPGPGRGRVVLVHIDNSLLPQGVILAAGHNILSY